KAPTLNVPSRVDGLVKMRVRQYQVCPCQAAEKYKCQVDKHRSPQALFKRASTLNVPNRMDGLIKMRVGQYQVCPCQAAEKYKHQVDKHRSPQALFK
ncbi:hypothetical protein E2320_003465, partial [Naja naja]